MMTKIRCEGRVAAAVFGLVFGLLVMGCEKYSVEDAADTRVASADAATTTPESTNTTSATEPTPAVPDRTDEVLNDDPGCELVVKYRGRNIDNEGQVHYLGRVLISDPFDSANPVCVQYNDTQTGEVTVWKDTANRGQRVDRLPTDRGINKIVVWYQ